MNGIAVIVPCYNLGRTLAEALESVRAQTRPATEVLVVDDGSDDPLTIRALTFAADSGARVLRTRNRGVAAARNVGVQATSAPYVVLLDADDVLDVRYLERLGATLDGRPELDFVTCGLRGFEGASYVWFPPPCSFAQVLARGGPHVSSMWRRRIWTDTGFDGSLAGYEDLDFWLAAGERGFSGDVLAEPLLQHRVRPGSRYRSAIQTAPYVRTMRTIYEKHETALSKHLADVIIEKDRFRVEQRVHRDGLRRREAELRATLAGFSAECEAGRKHLATVGQDPIDWGDLRRLSPLSHVWGVDRGGPLDRRYIEHFLSSNSADINGRVLEVKDASYTKRFGGTRVTSCDVVDVNAENSRATIIADLAGSSDQFPADHFDCFILSQTIHIIYDVQAVIRNAYKLLKPGGVLLCTVPCVSRVSFEDGGLESGDYWRFTEASVRRLVSEVFPAETVEVTAHGNVMLCAAFLLGLAPGELPTERLEAMDPTFPLICCVRAVKPVVRTRPIRGIVDLSTSAPGPSAGRVLVYHRVGSRGADAHGLSVDMDSFRRHLLHVRDRCVPMPLSELVERALDTRLPPRAVALTFDDGYLEHLTVISPLLLEYGLPATFFVNTDRVDEPHEQWWDVLERVMTLPTLPPVLDLYGDGRWLRPTASSGDREQVHRALVSELYPLGAQARLETLQRVMRWADAEYLEPRPSHRCLTTDEIRELGSRPGHTIGAHTVNHLCLPSHSAATQLREILDCRTTLEEALRAPVTSFAYPYGEYSSTTVTALHLLGLSIGVGVSDGSVSFATRPLLVPRLEVGAATAHVALSELDPALA